MKRKNYSPKNLYLFCTLLAVIICGTIYLGLSNLDFEGAKTSTGENSIQRQGHLKEIEVMQTLCDYDKDNIEDVVVHVEISDYEIISANIFVICKDKITDPDEQDKIRAIALECLNLDTQNVSIEYADMKEGIQKDT